MAETKRSSAVKIMLSPDMHEKLRLVAETLGQTPATLASIAVSQYVAQQTAALGASERAMAGLIDSMAPALQGALTKLLEDSGDVPATVQLNKLQQLADLVPPQPRNSLLDLATSAPQGRSK